MYFVYIIKSLKNNSYYIGSTSDLVDRLRRHNQGRSNFTKSKRPWELVYSKKFNNKSSAIKFEYYLKKQKSKKFIENLINNN